MEGTENAGGPKETSHSLNEGYPRISGGKTVRFTRWSLATISRLFIWYTLINALFSCPSNLSELDGLSPRVCEPYLTARSHIEPIITPYYVAYAGPYVETARPYAHNFNKNIYVPTKSFTVRTYHIYAAPHLKQCSRFLEAEWEKAVTPRLHSARDSLIRSYQSSIKPHIGQTKAFVVPRYQSTTRHLSYLRDTYYSPYYSQLEPKIRNGYHVSNEFVTSRVLPYCRRALSVLAKFVNGTLRPRISCLYFENVEPQLVRIGKKLASYREVRDVQRGAEEPESSIDETIPTSSPIVQSTSSESPIEDTPTPKPVTPSGTSEATSPTSSQSGMTTSEKIAADLHSWQERFAVAADDGCEYLGDQVVTIVQDRVESGSIKKGEDLVESLETVVEGELKELKTRINDIVLSMPEYLGPADMEAAEHELLQLLRSSGMAIRESAHALRQWFNDYDSDLVRQVTAEVASTLEVLDGIRDLGLQQIGMQWAWMDGVTYKDWAKFHALKRQFSEWRGEVSDVGMKHELLVNAREVASDILSRGMAVAETAAAELTKLKEIGNWKIEAGDDSDDFEPRTSDPAEYRASRRATIELDEELTSEQPEGDTVVGENDNEDGFVSDDGLRPASVTEEETPDVSEGSVNRPEGTEAGAPADEKQGEGFGNTADNSESIERQTPSMSPETSVPSESPDTSWAEKPAFTDMGEAREEHYGSHDSQSTQSSATPEIPVGDSSSENLAKKTASYEKLSEEDDDAEAEDVEDVSTRLRQSDNPTHQSSPSHEETVAPLESSYPDVDAILDSASGKLQSAINAAAEEVIAPSQTLQDGSPSFPGEAAADIEAVLRETESELSSAIHARPDDPDSSASHDELERTLRTAVERLQSLSAEAKTQLEELTAQSAASSTQGTTGSSTPSTTATDSMRSEL